MSDRTSIERTNELLEELLKWTKVTSIPKVKELLEALVKTPQERAVYAISDGKRTTREVSELAQVNKNTVSVYWRKWIRAGIAEPVASPGGGNRAKSNFLLEDFGIDTADFRPPKDGSEEEAKTDDNSPVKNNE